MEGSKEVYHNVTMWQSMLHWFEGLPDMEKRKLRRRLALNAQVEDLVEEHGITVGDLTAMLSLASPIPEYVQREWTVRARIGAYPINVDTLFW